MSAQQLRREKFFENAKQKRMEQFARSRGLRPNLSLDQLRVVIDQLKELVTEIYWKKEDTDEIWDDAKRTHTELAQLLGNVDVKRELYAHIPKRDNSILWYLQAPHVITVARAWTVANSELTVPLPPMDVIVAKEDMDVNWGHDLNPDLIDTLKILDDAVHDQRMAVTLPDAARVPIRTPPGSGAGAAQGSAASGSGMGSFLSFGGRRRSSIRKRRQTKRRGSRSRSQRKSRKGQRRSRHSKRGGSSARGKRRCFETTCKRESIPCARKRTRTKRSKK